MEFFSLKCLLLSQHFTHYVKGLTGTAKTYSKTECLAALKIFKNLNIYITLKKCFIFCHQNYHRLIEAGIK
jgi:hypothetical protein